MRWLRQNLKELLCLKDYKLLHLNKDLFSIRSISKISSACSRPKLYEYYINSFECLDCLSLQNHKITKFIIKYLHTSLLDSTLYISDYHHWSKGLNIWASRASWRWLGIYLDIKHEPTFVIRALIFFDMDHVVDDIIRWWSR